MGRKAGNRTYGNLACLVTAATTPPLSLTFLSFFFEPAASLAVSFFPFLFRPFLPEEEEGEESRVDEPGIEWG